MNWRNMALSGWAVVVFLIVIMFVQGCQQGINVSQLKQEIIRELKPELKMETYNFGIPWEKPYSYSQGNKIGNMIFVAGQLSHDMEGNMLITGDYAGFGPQFRQTLDNAKKVLANYGATLDDAVFLQNFVTDINDTYTEECQKILQEYFPKGQQTMTIAQVSRLFGATQNIESNMIAIVKE